MAMETVERSKPATDRTGSVSSARQAKTKADISDGARTRPNGVRVTLGNRSEPAVGPIAATLGVTALLGRKRYDVRGRQRSKHVVL